MTRVTRQPPQTGPRAFPPPRPARPAWAGLAAAWMASIVMASMVMASTAYAAGFEPDRWSAADRAAMQALLEFERTDEPRRLPESGAVFTIEQTVLRPRVCRRFTVTPPGGVAQTATACRTGPQQWALGDAAPTLTGPVAAAERPAAAIPDRPRNPALVEPPLPGRRPAVRTASATSAAPLPAFASLVPPRHPNAGDIPPWRSPLPRATPGSRR